MKKSMGIEKGKMILYKKEKLVYELSLEGTSYRSPHYPISIYCDGKCIDGHFIIKRRDPAEFEHPMPIDMTPRMTSPISQDLEISIAHSEEDLVKKIYTRAINLAEIHSRGKGFEFIDKTKEGSLEKTASV
jgi:hypothetical protein